MVFNEDMKDLSKNCLLSYKNDEIIGDFDTCREYNSNFNSNSQEDDKNFQTNILYRIIISSMDLTLTIILLPFTIFKNIYENDHLMVMLRVILEVSLELAMWLVLAGVSILTSAALIFDDIYSGKPCSENYKRLVKNLGNLSNTEEENRDYLNNGGFNDSPIIQNRVKNECEIKLKGGKETSQDQEFNPDNPCLKINSHYSSLKKEIRSEINPSMKICDSKKKKVEEDEDDQGVNFSFYKPIRRSARVVIENQKSERESMCHQGF